MTGIRTIVASAALALLAPAAALAGDGKPPHYHSTQMQQGRVALDSAPGARPGTWDHSYEYRPGKWAQTDYNFDLPSAPKTNPGPPDAHARQFNGYVSRFSAGVRSSPPLPKATLKSR